MRLAFLQKFHRVTASCCQCCRWALSGLLKACESFKEKLLFCSRISAAAKNKSQQILSSVDAIRDSSRAALVRVASIRGRLYRKEPRGLSSSTTMRSGRDDKSRGPVTATRLIGFASGSSQGCRHGRSRPGSSAAQGNVCGFGKGSRTEVCSATKLEQKIWLAS